MNQKVLKTSFFLCMFMHNILHPIQKSTADMGTFVVACLSMVGSYQVYRELPKTVHPVALASASCVMTGISYYMLHRSTPMGRIKRAHMLLNEIARHTLARMTFDNEKTFFDVVQDVYLTDDLPLISAYNHLLNLIPMARYALSLINKASAEVGKDVLLQEECDASFSRANSLLKNISEAVKRIREHKDYLSQLTIYKESLLYEKQTIAQEQMALAQLQMAQAQQSSTLLQWLKAMFANK